MRGGRLCAVMGRLTCTVPEGSDAGPLPPRDAVSGRWRDEAGADAAEARGNGVAEELLDMGCEASVAETNAAVCALRACTGDEPC